MKLSTNFLLLPSRRLYIQDLLASEKKKSAEELAKATV